MIIRRLKVRNVKHLREATFVPPKDAWLVVVAGDNDEGKSSALQSICMVLGGASFDPPVPIHHGQERASAEVDLGELTARCVWTKKGRRLEVVDKADPETKIAAPQTFLDRIVGSLAFDPLLFLTKPAPEQAKILAELLKIDFSEANAARAEAVTERTAAQRTRAAAEKRRAELEGEIVGYARNAVEVSLGHLLAEHKEALSKAAEREEICRRLVEARDRVDECEKRILTLEQQLAVERTALVSIRSNHQKAITEVEETPIVNVEAVNVRIVGAEEHNRRARKVAEFHAADISVAAEEEKVERQAEKIECIDRWKKEQLASAEFPIPNMEFSEDGSSLLLNGSPLEQCSDSERLRVGVAIGLRMTKDVKVILIRNGCFLDQNSLDQVERMAREAGVQIWVERVGKEGPATWIIEDGRIAASEKPRRESPRSDVKLGDALSSFQQGEEAQQAVLAGMDELEDELYGKEDDEFDSDLEEEGLE